MAVLGGGSEEIPYPALMRIGDTLVATITGGDVASPVNANGGQTNYASNGQVLITALPQFDRVVAGLTAVETWVGTPGNDIVKLEGVGRWRP